MVGASIFYIDGGIGCVYETKARTLQPDVHSVVLVRLRRDVYIYRKVANYV